jgi:hypothetical protein
MQVGGCNRQETKEGHVARVSILNLSGSAKTVIHCQVHRFIVG